MSQRHTSISSLPIDLSNWHVNYNLRDEVSMEILEVLDVAIRAAIKAGDRILEVYDKDFDVMIKEDKSPVTEADLSANHIIERILKEEYPHFALLTEEKVDDGLRFERKYSWIIDPLDGTKEFVKKNGEFSVNIALIDKESILLGVIYVPTTGQLFFAAKGHGAYEVQNGEKMPIHVSQRDGSLKLLVSRSHRTATTQQLIDENSDRILEVQELGSSMKGCYIAKGSYDAYYNFGRTMKWDTCAMECIVTEAGGVLRKLSGDKIDYWEENTANDHGFYILNKQSNCWLGKE